MALRRYDPIIRRHVEFKETRRVPIRPAGDVLDKSRPNLGQSGAMDIVTLQRLCARSWPGLEQDWLGEWELRAADGFTGRANSALPLGDAGLPVPEALDRVVEWYTARGLTPRLQVPAARPGVSDGDPASGVAALCDARGWAAEPWTLVMLRSAAPSATAGVQTAALRWSDEPDDAWLSLYHRAGAQLPSVARRVITAAPAQYLSVRLDGDVVGIGRVALVEELAVLTAIEVTARERRHGLGTLITEALTARAADDGARLTALQVFADNAAAVRLYRRLGFRTHHQYRYRSLSDG